MNDQYGTTYMKIKLLIASDHTSTSDMIKIMYI